MRFVLASASPARLATLRSAGLDPEVVTSDVDEDAVGAAAGPVAVSELVALLAAAKADAVAARLARDRAETADFSARAHSDPSDPDPADATVVLGCDSLLDLDGRPLGKPGSDDAVNARWAELAGRTGVLRTGHRVLRVDGGTVTAAVDETAATSVRFGSPTADELAAYIASGEPQQVAGGFTIDGLGGWFIDAVDGDHHTVVGLSLPVVRRLLAAVGVSLSDLGWPKPPSGPFA